MCVFVCLFVLGRRCPLLVALEAENKHQDRNTRETGAENGSTHPAKNSDLEEDTSGKFLPKIFMSSSMTQSKNDEDERRRAGKLAKIVGPSTSSKKSCSESTKDTTQFQEPIGKDVPAKGGVVGDLVESEDFYERSTCSDLREWKRHCIPHIVSCKNGRTNNAFPRHSPITAMVYIDKKTETSRRKRLEKPDANTCPRKKETGPTLKERVNPSLIGCSAETKDPLALTSGCKGRKLNCDEKTRRSASDSSPIKLPHIEVAVERKICKERKCKTRSGTGHSNSQKESCKCEVPESVVQAGCAYHEEDDLSLKRNLKYEHRGESSERSALQQTAVSKNNFKFDVLDQYSVLRKTSLGESSSRESIVSQCPNSEGTTPNESAARKRRGSGRCSSVKLSPLAHPPSSRDTRSFDAVRALWCVLQRERLSSQVSHSVRDLSSQVSHSVRDLSKGSVASELTVKNSTTSAKGHAIYTEVRC